MKILLETTVLFKESDEGNEKLAELGIPPIEEEPQDDPGRAIVALSGFDFNFINEREDGGANIWVGNSCLRLKESYESVKEKLKKSSHVVIL